MRGGVREYTVYMTHIYVNRVTVNDNWSPHCQIELLQSGDNSLSVSDSFRFYVYCYVLK
jgi:hypothetical protein